MCCASTCWICNIFKSLRFFSDYLIFLSHKFEFYLHNSSEKIPLMLSTTECNSRGSLKFSTNFHSSLFVRVRRGHPKCSADTSSCICDATSTTPQVKLISELNNWCFCFPEKMFNRVASWQRHAAHCSSTRENCTVFSRLVHALLLLVVWRFGVWSKFFHLVKIYCKQIKMCKLHSDEQSFKSIKNSTLVLNK